MFIIFLINMQKTQYFFKFLETSVEEGTVFYKIQVHLPGEQQDPIVFRARYSELRDIHDRCVKSVNKNDLPDFPEKKLFGTTKDDFIQKRKKQLQHYYNIVGKTIDIKKLPDLHNYLQSQRKKTDKQKKKEPTTQAKPKKQDQLKSVFDAIYKDVISNLINMTDDFYPQEETNMHKKYASQLNKIKPIDSALTKTPQIKGRQQNDGDFWSIFFMDDNDKLLKKADEILKKVDKIDDEVLTSRNNHNIAIAQ